MHDRSITFRCGHSAPNRLALAPMTNVQSNADGTLGDAELRWLVRRAEGGFGTILTCAAYVSEEGKAWEGQLGIADDTHLEGLTRLATALHEHDCCALVQLHHGGDKADLAPRLKLSTDDAEGVRGATAEDLARVVEDFTQAALRAEKAGFDGVEIHGANGYIFTQFLSPKHNSRTDAYGGDLEARARLIRETMRAIRAAVGPDFIVGVRLSPVDTWNRRGLVLADSLEVAKWLAEDGADFIHLSLQDASGPPPFEEIDEPVATAFRAALPADVPVMAAGSIATADELQAAFDAGVDIVAIARTAIGNPEWARHIGDEGYQPNSPPWTPEYLESVGISPPFLEYLKSFPGLVVGGKPAR